MVKIERDGMKDNYSINKVVILCSIDAFANSVKPKELEAYFTSKGIYTELVSTRYLSRFSSNGIGIAFPGTSPRKFILYVLEVASSLFNRFPGNKISRLTNSMFLMKILYLRGKIVHDLLCIKRPDIIICENNSDIAFLEHKRVADIQILDLPSPQAEEKYYGGLITNKTYRKYKKYEVKMYSRADHISFHWHTYAEYVKAHKYNGANFIDMSYGVNQKSFKAKYNAEPKIIFMGLLKGSWVNLSLLGELCRSNKNIDVFGGPKPPISYGINYKGYAPTKDIMQEYQFGLITISKDPLRKNSFSSKQLEYMSFGLPVISPSWRRDKLLDDATIYYDDVNDFAKKVGIFTKKNRWDEKSNKSIILSKQLSWQKAFRSLDAILIDKKTNKSSNTRLFANFNNFVEDKTFSSSVKEADSTRLPFSLKILAKSICSKKTVSNIYCIRNFLISFKKVSQR